MTIDERLEALTMNLELAFRDIQDLRLAIDANAALNTAMNAALIQTIRESAAAQAVAHEAAAKAAAAEYAEIRFEGRAQRDRIDTLVVATQSLLTVCQTHDARIARVERKLA